MVNNHYLVTCYRLVEFQKDIHAENEEKAMKIFFETYSNDDISYSDSINGYDNTIELCDCTCENKINQQDD